MTDFTKTYDRRTGARRPGKETAAKSDAGKRTAYREFLLDRAEHFLEVLDERLAVDPQRRSLATKRAALNVLEAKIGLDDWR